MIKLITDTEEILFTKDGSIFIGSNKISKFILKSVFKHRYANKYNIIKIKGSSSKDVPLMLFLAEILDNDTILQLGKYQYRYNSDFWENKYVYIE